MVCRAVGVLGCLVRHPKHTVPNGTAPSSARKMRVPGRADSTVSGLRSSWSGCSSNTPLAFRVVARVARPNSTLSPICRAAVHEYPLSYTLFP